jgi:hypothetical protein
MHFLANSMVSSKDMTRRFRVRIHAIERWMEEGLIPQCVWRNGYRYWSSDDINALITGCPVALPVQAASSIEKFTRRPAALDFISNAVALIITVATR